MKIVLRMIDSPDSQLRKGFLSSCSRMASLSYSAFLGPKSPGNKDLVKITFGVPSAQHIAGAS